MPGQVSCGQERWSRTAGQDRRTGQLERDSQDRTAREDSRDNTSRIENKGLDCQNRTARTGQLGQDRGIGQP
jgi:hypothetical protein